MTSKQNKKTKKNTQKETKVKIEDNLKQEEYIVLDGKKLCLIGAVCLAVIGGGFYFWNHNKTATTTTKTIADSSTAQQNNNNTEAHNTDKKQTETKQATQSSTPAKDLVIDTSTITDKASFIKYDNNGESMEIVAVKASDGSIRTAFNTCQVCYSSGKGYYKLEGDELVCQNCGNRFKGDQVGLTKGGCNPVPITSNERKDSNGKITVPGTVMQQASGIFKTWKKQA